MLQLLKDSLAHPLTRGLSIDDPRTTERRRAVIRSKPFLRAIYEEWCRTIRMHLPSAVAGDVLELGSGAGMLADFVPGLITSEVFPCNWVRLVADGRALPLASGSLRAIAMIDVLHHIPDVRRFFSEAVRCLRSGGTLVMIEPWVTPWSRFVYTRFHHEPFETRAPDWSFPEQGPLSGANGALPWIIFQRDRTVFEAGFPDLRVERIKPMMPFRYLVSGGVSMRNIMPGPTFPVWRAAEKSLEPWMRHLAMFALIVVRRRDSTAA